METRITISSTTTRNESDFLHLTYNTRLSVEDAMISVDSRCCGRVSWDKSAPFSHKSKPSLSNSWMNANKKDVENEVMKDIKNIAMPKCPFPTSVNPENTEDGEADSKSLILVRCDFKKSAKVQPYYPKLYPYNRSTPLLKYFKEEQSVLLSNMPGSTRKNFKSDKSDVEENNETDRQRHKSEPPRPVANNAHDSTHEGQENVESNGYAPQSPESRKKELCRYLKLMNPADKKEVLKLENRRSTRVRNLTIMEEKKHKPLEREYVREKSVPRSTLKSFKELDVMVEKCARKDSSNGKLSFCVPFPPKSVFQEVNDFDTVMSTLVPKFKRICDKKNIKYTKFDMDENLKTPEVTRNNQMKCLDERKTPSRPIPKKNTSEEGNGSMEKKSKTKKGVTKKNNSERINSLRSKGKLKSVSLIKIIGRKDKQKARWKILKRKELREKNKTIESKETRYTPCPVRSRKNSEAKSVIDKSEIASTVQSTENDIDLENFMNSMVDFESLSEEHRKCLIENRILSTKSTKKTYPPKEEQSESFSSLQTLPLYGFSKSGGPEKRNVLPKPISELQCSSPKLISEPIKEKKDPTKIEQECKGKREDYSRVKACQEKEDNFPREKTCEGKSVNKSGEPVLSPIVGGNTYLILNIHRPEVQVHSQQNSAPITGPSLQEHDYAGTPARKAAVEQDTEVDVVTVPIKNVPAGNYVKFNTKQLTKDTDYELLPYNKNVEMKSLHKSLQFSRKRNNNVTMDSSMAHEWDSDGSPKQKLKKSSHSINISKENGPVVRAFYVDYNLIVCQEFLISFWMQTPLGNVLGSQDMWVPRGQTQRIVPNNKCVQKESMERVICTESSVVYIELWMKEHKSEMRQGPVTDVFVTLYFWKQRKNGLDKKVLQLENINGFADDVQYSVMKSSQKIIVSWHCTNEDNVSKRTFIHAYLLAPDYQTVSNIFDIEPIDHYVSSLHNIEECDNLIMGCGENKITLWNVEFGYIIATVELKDIKSPLSTLWVKCDRGFLFALQQCVDRELRLIAINGINHSWKKLASYFPPEGFDRLRGVCVENGLLLSFYDQGILCWKAETGEPIEEVNLETDVIPSGKHLILVEDNQIIVKHVMTHLMSMSVEES